MTVTEIRSPQQGETYAEGLARAAQIEAEAEAQRIRNEAERRRQELANARAEAKATKDIQRDLEAAEDERREREAQRREAAERKARAAKSAETWKRAAKTIAVICVIVSLPLQILAFWDPKAVFLVAAPFVLEGVAWALLAGAQAAIDEGRPSWHYRLGALVQALIAAGINYAHGSEVYGIATGIGGALCSLIGPMIWDWHEHGRIAKRTGRKPRSVRRAEARAATAERKRLEQIAKDRQARDKRVWDRALYLAAALGELTPSEKTYRRAWDEIHGAEVGSTAATIAARRAARRAVRVASNGPLDGPENDAKPQVDSQMPPGVEKAPKAPRKTADADGRKGNGGLPPRRIKGDTARYSPAVRKQMARTAREAVR